MRYIANPANPNIKESLCINEETTDLLQWYVQSEKENLHSLEIALECKEFNTLILLGDQLYGHGASFGFPFISRIGKRIEIAAISQDSNLISLLILTLKVYLFDLQIANSTLNDPLYN
ncbi:MAG: Hpt domain-containing protein [Blastocatellia bacterium]